MLWVKMTAAAIAAVGMSILSAAVWALPDASGITSSISGTLDSRTVTVELKFDSADIGKEWSVFVALLSGKNVLFLNESSQFIPFDGKSVPRNVAVKPTSTSVSFSIARNVNVMALPGVALILGYGSSAEEMLAAQRFRQIYPSEVADGQTITLPTPRTPTAIADAQEMLGLLKTRLSKYQPDDPAITQDPGFLRDAWLTDQIGKQVAAQLQREQKILEEAAKTGTLILPPGDSVTIPSDDGSTLPTGCGKTLECKTGWDTDTKQTVLTVSGVDVPAQTTGSSGTTTTPVSITADEMPLQGAPAITTPASISMQSCMPWASYCTNKTAISSSDLGSGMEALASTVSSQAGSMLSQCAQYIQGVYNAQCPASDSSCRGSNDRAVVTGAYNRTTKQYDLECHEAAMVWTYTKGSLYKASVDASGAVLQTRSAYAMRLYKSFSDTKKASLEKLIGNVLVGQVPYLNVANSLVKCVSGQSAVDWAFNAFTAVDTLACIETAANLVKSVAAVPTLPLRIQETRVLYQNMSLAASAIKDEAKYIGWGATGLGVATEFYRRGKVAIQNADLHQ